MRTSAILFTFVLSFFPSLSAAGFELCARAAYPVPARVRLENLRPRPPAIIVDGAAYLPKVGESAAATYMRLAEAGYLISQMDSRLAKRGLIIPGGGLCASACGLNVMHALLVLAGGDTLELFNHADEKLQFIVDAAKKRYGLDARQGLKLGNLKRILADIAQARNLSLGIEHVVSFVQQEITLAELNPRPNELNIVTVQTGINDGKVTYHALVILAADPLTGLITYSNPNQPNEIRYVVSEPAYGEWGGISPRMVFAGMDADQYTGVITEYIKLGLR